jgi:hypothetical protein
MNGSGPGDDGALGGSPFETTPMHRRTVFSVKRGCRLCSAPRVALEQSREESLAECSTETSKHCEAKPDYHLFYAGKHWSSFRGTTARGHRTQVVNNHEASDWRTIHSLNRSPGVDAESSTGTGSYANSAESVALAAKYVHYKATQ